MAPTVTMETTTAEMPNGDRNGADRDGGGSRGLPGLSRADGRPAGGLGRDREDGPGRALGRGPAEARTLGRLASRPRRVAAPAGGRRAAGGPPRHRGRTA